MKREPQRKKKGKGTQLSKDIYVHLFFMENRQTKAQTDRSTDRKKPINSESKTTILSAVAFSLCMI